MTATTAWEWPENLIRHKTYLECARLHCDHSEVAPVAAIPFLTHFGTFELSFSLVTSQGFHRSTWAHWHFGSTRRDLSNDLSFGVKEEQILGFSLNSMNFLYLRQHKVFKCYSLLMTFFWKQVPYLVSTNTYLKIKLISNCFCYIDLILQINEWLLSLTKVSKLWKIKVIFTHFYLSFTHLFI
jgi:hypothetical protein